MPPPLSPLLPLLPLLPLAVHAELCPCPIYRNGAKKGENAKLLQRIKINENKFSKLFFQPLYKLRAEGVRGRGDAKLTLENDSSVIKQSKGTKRSCLLVIVGIANCRGRDGEGGEGGVERGGPALAHEST